MFSIPSSLLPSFLPNDPQHSLPSSVKPKICFNIVVGNVLDYKLDSIFAVVHAEQKYATSMRPVGLSGEYATPLRCRPWLSSWHGKRKAACGQKLLWCRRADSMLAGKQAARSSSFFPITNYAYAMLDCNWWQGRTQHRAHSSRSPWLHLKLPLQALAQNFHVTRVCNCHAPQQAGQSERGADDDDASKFPL